MPGAKPAKTPQTVKVRLYSTSASRETEGTTRVTTHSGSEAFFRGFRISAKIVFWILLACVPFVFIEPFLAMVWGSVVLGVTFLIVGPLLHLRFAQERRTFDRIDGLCPCCERSDVLNAYVSAEFKRTFTVLCPGCGQTCSVEALEESSAGVS